MGKSIRCKVKKRLRSLKREQFEQQVGRDQLSKLSHKLQTAPGIHSAEDIPKLNAFLYPEDAAAAFPQYQKPTLIDFRNANVDFSGFEFRGSGRKNRALVAAAEAAAATEGDFELEKIEEVKQDEEEFVEVDEEDLLQDFNKMGLENNSKKIKKKKRADGMEDERDFIPLPSKSKKKKNQDGCKKSRKIMRW
jgi:hypothetical protein